MLLAIAEAVVDDCERVFLEGLGSAERIAKGRGDFATSADVQIELMLRRELTNLTGIAVYGEEGGGSLAEDAVWVVDPIDGTSNYAAGSPMCAILVSLLHHGQPIVALCALPALGKRLTCFAGSPLLVNGKPQQPLATPAPELMHVGFGSLIAGGSHALDSTLRLQLLGALGQEYTRLRLTGSVGVDLAFAALGIFGAAVTFSPFTWDNAAGVLLAQAAGLTVTDLAGKPWSVGATGVIAGSKAVHAGILSTIKHIAK